MSWTFLRYEGAIGHVVAERFVSAVKADLKGRGVGPIIEEKVIPTMTLDGGGSCLVGEPVETVLLDGFRINVPVSQVSAFIARMDRAGVRADGYVKIHGHWCCLVIAPFQRDTLAASLRAVAEQAANIHAAFMTAWKERFANK